MKKQLLNLFLLFILFTVNVNAQQLFKDLIPGPSPASSNPEQFTNVNGTMYFISRGGNPAVYKLWKSDGTPNNTLLVKDSIIVTNLSGVVNIVASMNSYVYYVVNIGNQFTRELWKSDGTTLGTTLVSTFTYSSTSGSAPANFIAVGNQIFFQFGAENGHGRELWKTDGTAAGTMEVINLDPGSSGGSEYAGVSDKPMGAYNGKLYFAGTTNLGNYELFTSDGTPGGTVLVQELQAGPSASSPVNWTVCNNELYFVASNGSYDDLWKTDGTVATKLSNAVNVGPISAFNSNIYFQGGGKQLWKSDGSIVGTVFVKDSVLSSTFLGANGNYMFTSFTKYISSPPYIVTTYYRSDGTALGTTRVSYDIGTSASYEVLGNNMYTTRLDSGSFSVVGFWKSDGTPAGTSKLLSSSGMGLTHVFNNDVFFANSEASTGGELWSLNPLPSVGIEQTEINLPGSIYPNPSTGVFIYKVNSNLAELSIKVYNIIGENIMEVNGSNTFDLSNNSKGIYFVQIVDGDKTALHKVILD